MQSNNMINTCNLGGGSIKYIQIIVQNHKKSIIEEYDDV